MNIIVIGLSFGDEGKGSVVDYLCRTQPIDCVIRYTGAHQCGHYVREKNGQSHIFSQFGSGTLAGVPTYYGPYCIFEPFAWEVEKKSLISKGFNPVFYVNSNCLVSTPYHKILNQLRERCRNIYEKHGSCGVGVGETRSYWLKYGQDAIIVNDFFSPAILLDKLRLMYFRIREEINQFSAQINISEFIKEIEQFSPEFLTKRYTNWFSHNQHIINDYFGYIKELHLKNNNYVFEGSQGVLLDENYGYKPPHVTWSTTTPKHAFDFIEENNLSRKKSMVVGVVRSYMTRHGQGPFPSEMKLDINNDGGSTYSIYNGEMRYGLFDFDLFKYSIGIAKPDCIFLNCLDEYPGMYYISGKTYKANKEEFLKKINDYCSIKYVGYGPTADDKKEY